ncbi:putative nuclease HARBI1 [Diorhabda carinulata]|uniref:putative nuclease HARBI1 n=1 Tax=Diorhabda carinulata TaxID=1163345 RepID=UPI0025A1052F|nr:putative nuclease HARBI1 [Diorhabda carinulata]
MDHKTFEDLLTLLRPRIAKQDTVIRKSIPASQRLSITLRYLASGADFEDLKFQSRIAPRTLSGIIIETCEAINEKLSNIQIPKTQESWKILARQFGNSWNFDNCIGAVDGKHITLQKPEKSGSYYYNYKGTHSKVLMAIANANYELIMIDVGTNGRVSDGGVIKNTKF